MLTKAFRQNTQENRLIRLVMVFALAFAALHVALHDLGVSHGGLDGHDKCQVCRLNHVPIASLPLPPLLAPLQVLTYVLTVADTDYQLSHQFHTQWARAPPLF